MYQRRFQKLPLDGVADWNFLMVLTNGSREAREAILNIYRDPESGFQQLLDEKAATHDTHSNTTFGPFAVSQPPKLDRSLSMINERQLASYSVQLQLCRREVKL